MQNGSPRTLVEVATSLREWGSIERYVVSLADSLEPLGWQPHVVGPPGSPIQSHCRVPFHPIRLSGKYWWPAWPAFVQLFKKLGPRVVQVHFSPDFLIPALAARAAKVEHVVLTRHLALRWSRKKALALASRFTRFVGVSQAVSDSMVSSGVPARKVSTVLSGIRPLASQVQESRDGFSVGFFGRLVDVKGVDVAIQAIAKVPTAQLHVFGSGPDSSRLKALAGSNVVFHGKVDHVADAMAAMHAVVVPSLWEEAFAFSVLEAISLGKPVVASRVGGVPEAVRDHETGLVVPKGDPDALAEALRQLADDPGFRQKLGREAKRVYEQEFTLEAMASRYDRLFTQWETA